MTNSKKYLDPWLILGPNLECMICQHSIPILVHQLVPGQQVHPVWKIQGKLFLCLTAVKATLCCGMNEQVASPVRPVFCVSPPPSYSQLRNRWKDDLGQYLPLRYLNVNVQTPCEPDSPWEPELSDALSTWLLLTWVTSSTCKHTYCAPDRITSSHYSTMP